MICPHCHGLSLTVPCLVCGGSGYVSEPATDTTTDADPWAEIARLEGRVRELEPVAEAAAWFHDKVVRTGSFLGVCGMEFTVLEGALRAAGYLKEVNNAG